MLFPQRRLAALFFTFFLAAPAWGQWINEIHYDNASTDVGEAVEVIFPATVDTTNFTLYLYNGNGGTVYGGSYSLGGFTEGSTVDGFTVYWMEISGIQNGAEDGLALVEGEGVVQFLSYEGTITATDGPAAGMTSTDIGVAETGSTPIGHSLQLVGTGSAYEDFIWTGPVEDSFGFVNDEQSLEGPAVPTVSFASPNSQTVTEGTDTQVEIAVQITNAGAEAVSVDVVLIGGTADEDDFGGTTTQSVTFPANAPDGSTQIATFPLTDDEEDEGTETAVFELQNVSDGPDAVIGSPSTYTLTIEDDDASPPTHETYLDEDFEDGNLSGWGNADDWSASPDGTITGAYSLKHGLSSQAGASYIYHALDDLDLTAGVTRWRFNLKNGSWTTTQDNRFLVVLAANGSDFIGGGVDGYAVGVNLGNSEKRLSLWRISGGSPVLVIESDLVWDGGYTVGVEVVRGATGFWELRYDADGGFDDLVLAGTGADSEYTAADYYGLVFHYTTRRAGQLWHDDVMITQTPPVVASLVINEVHPDPHDSLEGDASNDGVRETYGDEFVEIVNVSDKAFDLSGFGIRVSGQERHRFPEGTVLEPNQAIVVFGGGDPQGNFGGALVQVTTDGDFILTNSGDTVELSDQAGSVVDAFVYTGTAGTANSWTLYPDLEGELVRHNEPEGSVGRFSPGTWVDGTPFSGGNAGAVVTVPKGGAGWRMLAPPVAGMTVGDLAAQNLVQGIPGEYPGAAANLHTGYTGTGFVAPSGKEEALESGHGFIWFLYGVRYDPASDGITDGDSESFPMPFTLEALGTEPAADVTVPLHTAGEGWNLLGNPFAEAIDLDQMTPTGGDLVSIIGQVWDPEARTYRLTSYDTTATAANPLAIWQGAFFQNDDAEEITFPAAAKIGSGAPSYGRPGDGQARGQIGFELAGPGWESGQPVSLDRAIVLYLDAEASDGWDRRDATKLTPLRSTYATLAFVGERDGAEVLKAQDSRPFEGGDFEVPLAFESVGVSGTFGLSWPRWVNVPDDWAITLTDADTGQTVDLRSDTLYTFTASAAREAASADALAPPPIESLRRSGEPRFVLTVERGSVDAEDGAAPLVFELGAVHPNPASESAAVRYALPEAADVRLEVYDVLGRRVATLADGPASAGRHTASVRTAGLASGVYVVRLRAGEHVASRRFVVVR